MTPEDERRQLDAARAHLVREFADRVPEAEVNARFGDIVHGFAQAPIRSFVPVLASRQVRAGLRQRVRG